MRIEQVLQACPAIGGLDEYLAGLSTKDLAAYWPACFAEAISVEGDLPVGVIAGVVRASLVVSERLYGVRFTMTQELGGKARTLSESGATLATGAGFTVSSGPPPAPSTSTRTRNDPLINALIELKPGQHIAIDPKRIKKPTLNSKVNTAKKRGGHKNLSMYVAADDRLIVFIGAGEKAKL